MKNRMKAWLVIAAALVVLGCMVFGGALVMVNWDITKLGTAKYETNHYEIAETFGSIAVSTNTANVIFQPSEDGKVSIRCYEESKAKHTVEVKNGVLEIRLADARKWYDHINFLNFKSPEIIISVPKGQYGALSIKSSTGKVKIPADFQFESLSVSVSTGNVTSSASVAGAMKIKATTGNITVQNVSAGAVDLTASTGKITGEGISCAGTARLKISTGDITLKDFQCRSFSAAASTGDLQLRNVIVVERMDAQTDTGSVTFDGCDAGEMKIVTDTGSVTGSLLSPKIFFAETDTGKVDVPRSTTGGRCEITTDTGNIRITIK